MRTHLKPTKKLLTAQQIRKEMAGLANPEKAALLSRFFKTGKGQYGEGDIFLGIMVPGQRRIARKYCLLPMNEIRKLLQSRIHEHRLVALLILVIQYEKADPAGQGRIFDFYLKNTSRINNWDLVDLSAPRIAGKYLLDRDKSLLYRLARSRIIWERRIAVLSTFAFIANQRFEESLKIAEMLLNDSHDLIHKAVGWMLREIGKRDLKTEEDFLDIHAAIMPRTMLRYAIERFEEKTRKKYLNMKHES